MIMTNKNLEGRNMQTIIVLLNPGMLENADLDLRYRIPDRIEEVSNIVVQLSRQKFKHFIMNRYL